MILQHEVSNAIATIAINRPVCIHTLFGTKGYSLTAITGSKQPEHDYE